MEKFYQCQVINTKFFRQKIIFQVVKSFIYLSCIDINAKKIEISCHSSYLRWYPLVANANLVAHILYIRSLFSKIRELETESMSNKLLEKNKHQKTWKINQSNLTVYTFA
jgi:hypothetical protein